LRLRLRIRMQKEMKKHVRIVLVILCLTSVCHIFVVAQNQHTKVDSTLTYVDSMNVWRPSLDWGQYKKMSTSAYPIRMYVTGHVVKIESDHNQVLPIYNQNGVFLMAMRLSKGMNSLAGLPRGWYFVNNRPVKIN